MRRLALALALLLAAVPRAGAFRVATWNLDWLTSRRAGDPALPSDVHPRRPGDFARLAAYAVRLNADVVAIQEVDGARAAARVFPPARYVIDMTHDHVVQRVGFAIRRGLRFTRHKDLTALAPPGSWLRSGADITVQLRSGPLRILAVHLKAGCQFSALRGRRPACKTLARQVPPLVAWIAARARHATPFLILGDFNRKFDPHHGHQDGLWRRLTAAAPLVRAERGFASPCWGAEYFIDHILAGGAARAWLVPGSLRVLVYAEHGAAWKSRLSDHCPVSVRLRPPARSQEQAASPFVPRTVQRPAPRRP